MATLHARHERGFIALTSTIIISAVLIALMAEVDLSSFYALFDALGSESKRASLALAESCVQVALLALATSTDPAHFSLTNMIVGVGQDAPGNAQRCVIQSIVHNAAEVSVSAYASSNNSYSEVSARASLPPDITIISWSY